MKRLVFVLSFLLSSIGFAQSAVDVAPELAQYMTRHFVGMRADTSKKWDNSNCVARNPITGNCIEEAGFNIEAKGFGQIDSFLDSSGKMKHFHFDDEDGPVNFFRADFFMNFSYFGRTSAQKVLFPGGVFGGWEWRDSEPKGRVEMRIVTKEGNNWQMYFSYFAYPGNEDHPNTVVKEAVIALQGRAKGILEDFLKMKGYTANIIIGAPN